MTKQTNPNTLPFDPATLFLDIKNPKELKAETETDNHTPIFTRAKR
jgi:hypothetical protein